MSKIPVATASHHVRSSSSQSTSACMNTCSPTTSLNSSSNLCSPTCTPIHSSAAVNLSNENLIESTLLPITSKSVMFNHTTDTKNAKNIDSVINSHLPKLTKDIITNDACNFNDISNNSIASTVRYKRSPRNYCSSNLPISVASNVTMTRDDSKDGHSSNFNHTSPSSQFNSSSSSSYPSPSSYPSRILVPNCQPTTTPIVASLNHSRNESPSPSLKSPPKFEAFMMTGDLMINLASKQTTDNPLTIHDVSDNISSNNDIFGVNTTGIPSYNNKRCNNFNSRKFHCQQQQQQLSSSKYNQSSNVPVKFITTSLPCSPESIDKQQRDKFTSSQLTQPSSKSDQDEIHSTHIITTPTSTMTSTTRTISPLHKQKTFAVRLSKSQHELQQDNYSQSPSPTPSNTEIREFASSPIFDSFDKNTIECNMDNDMMSTLECDKDVTITCSDIVNEVTTDTIEISVTCIEKNELSSVSPRENQDKHDSEIHSPVNETTFNGGKNDTFKRNSIQSTDVSNVNNTVEDKNNECHRHLDFVSSSPSSTSRSIKSSNSSSSTSTAVQSNKSHGDSDLKSNCSTVKSTCSSVINTSLGKCDDLTSSNGKINSNSDQSTEQSNNLVKVESAKRYPSFIGSTVSDDDADNDDDDDEIVTDEYLNSINQDKCDSIDSSSSSSSSTCVPGKSSSSYPFSPPKAVDHASASRLARRLFDLQGFKKCDVSRHLSKNNEFSKAVAEEYLRLFDFTDDRVDCALRKFLIKLNLVGETDERERVLSHFSKRLLQCNQDSFKSVDAVHTLTCALMLLNTDLHSESVGRRMTLSQFIENLSGLHDGSHFNQDLLKALYFSIKNQPLQWAHDEDDTGAKVTSCNGSNLTSLLSGSDLINDSNGKNILDQSINPFLGISSGGKLATEYKKGYLLRKCCYDRTGKKTPLGKRRWKNFYATLRDLVLYLHKDETGFRKNQLYESLKNSIRIHHALASKASDYIKKDFVFRLHTADQAEYLFKASDAHEMQLWIDSINFAAASLSSPPLAPAVGSEQKFQRPLLPVSHTKLNLREQLIQHEERITQLEQELEVHLDCPPERSTLKRSLNDYTEKQLYLQFELKRYRIYSSLLKTRLLQSMGPQAFEKVINPSKCISLSSSKGKPLISLPIAENDDDTDDDK